jgi:hypothetical protein
VGFVSEARSLLFPNKSNSTTKDKVSDSSFELSKVKKKETCVYYEHTAGVSTKSKETITTIIFMGI